MSVVKYGSGGSLLVLEAVPQGDEPVTEVALGCSRCRFGKSGCPKRRGPGFRGKRRTLSSSGAGAVGVAVVAE